MGCGELMDIVKLCGFGILAVAVCAVVKRIKPESALGVNLAAGIAILAAAVSMLAPSVEAVSALARSAGIDNALMKLLMKAMAVCYITTLCSDCARDAGEAALGAKLEMAGRAAVAAVSLPAFTSLASIVSGMISG